MSFIAEKRTTQSMFVVSSVEKTDAPDGCDGEGWYRYVLERGTSTIVGNRRGTLQQVRTHAREYAEEINNRAANGGASTWSPKIKGRKNRARNHIVLTRRPA